MIDYEEDWLVRLLFSRAGSVFAKSCCFAVPAACITLAILFTDDYLPQLRNDYDFKDIGSSTLWSASTAGIMLMIGFRTNRAIQRFWEGTGLLHQMRGEWFDTVSNCVSFSLTAKGAREGEVLIFRHTLVRLMSLCHGNALEEISGNTFELETIDVHGLSQGTLTYLKTCHEEFEFNKVELCVHLIQSLITKAFQDGILEIPAPIMSRVYQTISRGFVNLLNTKKITDTKFPFPYVQLISLLMIAYTILTPLVLTSLLSNKVIAATCTFLPVLTLSALNYISMELENPFGKDDNDLPLDHFQCEMDLSLLMLLHPHTDTVAGLSLNCEANFDALVKTFQDRGESENQTLGRSKRFHGIGALRHSISGLLFSKDSNKSHLAAQASNSGEYNNPKAHEDGTEEDGSESSLNFGKVGEEQRGAIEAFRSRTISSISIKCTRKCPYEEERCSATVPSNTRLAVRNSSFSSTSNKSARKLPRSQTGKSSASSSTAFSANDNSEDEQKECDIPPQDDTNFILEVPIQDAVNTYKSLAVGSPSTGCFYGKPAEDFGPNLCDGGVEPVPFSNSQVVMFRH